MPELVHGGSGSPEGEALLHFRQVGSVADPVHAMILPAPGSPGAEVVIFKPRL
jgi:hypothetical protein